MLNTSSPLQQAMITTHEIIQLYGQRRRPRIILDDNYNVKEVHVSSSLIKKMFFRNEPRDFCPHKLYHVDIVFTYFQPPTPDQLKGLYFESQLLGATANGDAVNDLPRRKRSGKKTADHIRIDEQVRNARRVFRDHGIIVVPEGKLRNVQLHKRIHFPDFSTEHMDAYLDMTLDLVSPLELASVSYTGVIIDIKLTRNLETEYGPFCWGKPQFMDHSQAFIYAFYLDMPFFYLVFDYPPSNAKHRFVPINTNVNHKDPKKAAEARVRFQETHELIRKAINMLLEYVNAGWYTNPSYQNCKDCPVIHCKDRNKNQEI